MTLSYLITKRKRSNNFFRGYARVTRAGATGARLMAVAAPLTPRPRGTIYATVHSSFDRHKEQPNWDLGDLLSGQFREEPDNGVPHDGGASLKGHTSRSIQIDSFKSIYR